MTDHQPEHGTSPIALIFVKLGGLVFAVAFILLLLDLDRYGLGAVAVAIGLMLFGGLVQKVLEHVFEPREKTEVVKNEQ